MTSIAERKRRKRAAKISLAGGEAVDQRPTGRDRRHINKPEDARKTVADARMRFTGIQDAKEAIQPIHGTDMGNCIHALTPGDERPRLVEAWAAISAAHRNYRLFYIGQTGTPNGAAIPMLPEPMQTDQSLRVDLRTHEERVEGAKRAWKAWEAQIAALPVPNLRWAISGALSGFMGDGALWRDQRPTTTGKVAVTALRMLATDGKCR